MEELNNYFRVESFFERVSNIDWLTNIIGLLLSFNVYIINDVIILPL